MIYVQLKYIIRKVENAMGTAALSDVDIFSVNDNFQKYKKIKSELRYGRRLKNIKLSIMIPAYKRTTYLKRAIDSVLQQKTNYSFEVVVVDNTVENDAIFDIVGQYRDERVAYYKNETNIGMFGNWNRCIELAGADYFCILSDDDMLKHDFVEKILNKLATLDSCAAISANFEFVDEMDRVVLPTDNSGMFYQMNSFFRWYKDFQVCVTGSVISKKAAMDIGGFSEELYPGSDVAFMVKLNYLTKQCYHYFVCLAQYRVASNESINATTQVRGIRFVNWFVNSLARYLCLDGNFHKLHRRVRCLEQERLYQEWFSGKADDFKDLNLELGLCELNDYENQNYRRYCDFYMQRVAINNLGELAYVGDLIIANKE